MKKKSFFERLTSNLRFNETEEEEIFEEEDYSSTKLKNREPLPSREISLSYEDEKYSDEDEGGFEPLLNQQEEVGELSVDVYETRDEIIIQTLIAGVSPEHLSINTTRDSITISGKREPSKTVAESDYFIKELYWGKFERSIDLPEEVDIDKAEAIERHGMLLIKLPKLDKKRKAVLKIESI